MKPKSLIRTGVQVHAATTLRNAGSKAKSGPQRKQSFYSLRDELNL